MTWVGHGLIHSSRPEVFFAWDSWITKIIHELMGEYN